MDGWKRKEADSEELIKKLKADKSQMESSLQEQAAVRKLICLRILCTNIAPNRRQYEAGPKNRKRKETKRNKHFSVLKSILPLLLLYQSSSIDCKAN